MTVGLPRALAGRVTLALSLLGLAISVYLTVEHFSGSQTFACPENATFNCVAVTTSKWAAIAGIPVAVLGLVFFVAMTALCLVGGRRVADLRVVAAVVGVLTALWLVYVELFLVDALCLWCTGVHLVTLVLLGTTVWWREHERATVTA